jgi:hypothetical protein
MLSKKRAATLVAPIATTLLFLPVLASERLDQALESVTGPIKEVVVTEPEVEQVEDTVATKEWIGENFTEQETLVLEFLQEYGITDRASLATILGNIRQESRFDTIICEGGARTGYAGCHRGGFGLIQWTTVGRYRGLGAYARQNNLNPNDLKTQLGWMVNEVEWTKVEHIFKSEGGSIDTYMRAAKRWLGWGIHGQRTVYAHQYYQALSLK